MTTSPPSAQDRRQALREQLIRRRRAELAGGGVVAVARDGGLPLSEQQAGLWFLYQLDPESATYHLPLVVRLRGELDRVALAAAVRAVVARHEGLRTRFALREGSPEQLIDPPPEVVSLPVTELPVAGWQQVVAAEVARPFRLLDEPGFRCWLGRLGGDEHVLVLNCHHILTDGWSLGILLADLGSAYRQARAGTSVSLTPLAVQPADYAVWQQQHPQLLQAGLDYWAKQLAELPTVELPTDRARPAVPTGAGAGFATSLDPSLAAGVTRLAEQQGTGPLAVLLAGLNLVLHRYTGQTDLAIGTILSGRTRSELEPLIGYLANTVVLRTRWQDQDTGADLVRHCQEVVLQAMQHQETPFALVVDTLQPARVPGRNPLFQVALSLLPAGLGAEVRLGELAAEQLTLDTTTSSRFDLSLQVAQHADGTMTLWAEYSTELFDRDRVERLTEHLQAALAGLLADPDRRLDGIEILAGPERELVVHGFNEHPDQPPAPLPWAGSSVVDGIEATARTVPGTCALWCDGAWLSYAQLAAAAAELAVRLADAGVRRGDVVAVCGFRSLELVVGLLAVLRAGAAYLPLDPDQPATRSEFQLADAGAVALLAQPGLGPRPPAGLPRIELVPPWQPHTGDPDAGCDDQPVPVPGADLLPVVGGSDAAYLIYTSGSTGNPKGVLNNHAGLANRLGWMQARYPLDGSDRVLQKTPYTFDVSVWEFFWPLLTGARLVLAAPDGHRRPRYLATVLAEQRISVSHFVPSVLAGFLDQPDLPRLPALRHLFCSGEALPAATRDRALHRLPGAGLHNLYGPTEASIDVTAWTCSATDGPTVVIGRPIANLRCYVLDDRLRPAPVGVTGRLYLAGVGLATGYLNRPALTAERFPPCPFGGPGERMYDTGDLARWRPDGTLEYHGRTDHQVKLHGQRIELGEIEHALSTHPAVTAAAVTLVEPGGGRPAYLAGYLTASPVPADAELRDHLAERLPVHMVPATLTVLDALPLNANGKLDRNRLPVVEDVTGPDLEGSGDDSPVRQAVAAVWAEVLERGGPVRPSANFFTEGGSSLALARLTAAIEQRCGVPVTVRDLYLAPTLAAMAALVERRSGGGSDAGTAGRSDAGPTGQSSLLPLRAAGSRSPLFLVHAVGGSAVPYLPLVELLDPAQPVYAFEAAGLHGGPDGTVAGLHGGTARPDGTVAGLAAGYLAELRRLQPSGPYRLAGWSVGGLIAQQLAVLLRGAGEEVALLAVLDSVPAEAGTPVPDHAGLLGWFVHDLIGVGGRQLPELDAATLRGKSPAEQQEHAWRYLGAHGVVDERDRAVLGSRFAVFRELATAFLRHRPVALDRPTELLMTAGTAAEAVPRWQAVGGRFEVHPVPGNHYTILRPPQLAAVAEVLDRLLARAAADRPDQEAPRWT